LKPSLVYLPAFVLASLVSAVAIGCSSSATSPSPSPGADAGADADATPAPADGPVVIDCPTPTGGPTSHSGDVKGDETWTAAASPHIISSSVAVRDGAKLTIEPCATVLVAQDQRLSVAFPLTPNTGTLIAEGTPEHPIRFAGQDGARWADLYIDAPGTARLKYVTLEGGGSNAGDGTGGATIFVNGDSVLPADPTILLDHVTIKGSANAGLWMRAGATFLPGSTDLVVTQSGSDTSPYPVRIEEHSMDGLPTGSYTGNKIDEILLQSFGTGIAGGGLIVDATLHDRGVPYRVGGHFNVGGGNTRATLTIEPGVTIKFEPQSSLRIQTFTGDTPANAAIVAVGTAAKPIVFTSAAAVPQPGDWEGLWFGGSLEPTNRLDYVHIEYAGWDCGCIFNTCSDITTHEGAVILTNPPPNGAFITNSTFKAIAGHGVTEGFGGSLVNFRPTNTFDVSKCVQTLPKVPSPLSCPNPLPACDGL
jgi:hypothetical protein